MSKRPVSVLVVVHAGACVLLLRRVGSDGFWQSITGSLEAGESPLAAARREVFEETGLEIDPAGLTDWRLSNRFVIPVRWRGRYAPGVTHNVEHVFSVALAESAPPRLNPGEHSEARWVGRDEALTLAWSWTNRDAIRLVLPS